MAEQMEVLLKSERKQEAEEVLQLLNEMSTEEQKEMLVFIQGMVFAKNIKKVGEK